MISSNTSKRIERANPRSGATTPRTLPDLTTADTSKSTSTSSICLPDINEMSFSAPRRAPSPPSNKPKSSLRALTLDFPLPPQEACSSSPVSLTRSHACKVNPMQFRRATHSPASSISSGSVTSVASSSSSQLNSTPATSEDDVPSSAATINPKRLSFIFAKSLPDLHRDLAEQFNLPDPLSESECESEDGEEDSEWLTREMKDFISISHDCTSGVMADGSVVAARPESFLPPPRTSVRYSKSLRPSAGPSAQLDPTFPFSKKKAVVPTHPPSPPSATSFTRPALLYPYPSSASTVSSRGPVTPLTSTSIRPPPRSSIPCDIDELMQMDMHDFDLLEEDLKEAWPESPFDSEYRNSFNSCIGFEMGDVLTSLPPTPGSALPDSPVARMYIVGSSVSRQPSSASTNQVLRSRWSSSTLSSMNSPASPASASSWISKFSIRNKKSKVPPIPAIPAVTKPVKKEKLRKFAGSDLLLSRSRESSLERRDSRSSRISTASSESYQSVGLKRKPIAIEVFNRM